EGRAILDVRADIYAMGAVLYELLTGRPPFLGEPAEVRLAHVALRPLPVSRLAAVPEGVEEVVLRCLAKTPDQRVGSAAELAALLGRALERPGAPRMDRPAAGSPRPAAASAPVMAGVLRFESASNTARVQKILGEHGGRLASVSGRRCVAVAGID